ncbi:MAG: hypothetical protein P8L39_13710 [Halioglobus sp.]|nr:hypothetical protein [Halioglobus sp.]
MRQPQFFLRTGRDYLHSATVFDAIINVLDYEPTDIDFTFLKKTTKNCALSKNLPETKRLVAEYTDARQTIYVVEGEEEIEKFQDYDDSPIDSTCEIANKIASIQEIDSRYSVIESVIAAYKFLLQDVFGVEKKYVFARVRLSGLPVSNISVRYQRAMSNNFYQAAIYEADRKVGFILFGEWQ